MQNNFSLSNNLKKSFEDIQGKKYKINMGIFILFLVQIIISIIFYVGLPVIMSMLDMLDLYIQISGALDMVMYLVIGFIEVGLLYFIIKLLREEEYNLANIFEFKNKIMFFMTLKFFYIILILLGTLALVLPGIYLAIALMYASIIAADQDKGIIESLKESLKITKGYWWKSFLTVILMMLVNIVSMIPMVIVIAVTTSLQLSIFLTVPLVLLSSITFIWSVPLAYVMYLNLYEHLKNN